MESSTKQLTDIRQMAVAGHRLRIAGTIGESIVDGEGYRYTIFTQGCPHHCFGCHNPQTHDFQGGRLVEPARLLAELARELHSNGLNIWCYTGYTYEVLQGSRQQAVRDLLRQVDVLVDGPFIEAQRDISLRFRGSSNQRLIDMPASRSTGGMVLYKEPQ